MLRIYSGPTHRNFCDSLSRRSFIQIGGLAAGGLTLPGLLQAEQSAGLGNSNKSVIMVYLPGGPPHQDMFELKMNAPSEIRGEFQPISTKVPGIQICELLPKMAARMDKLVPIRTMVGAKDRHASFQCMTGHLSDNQPPGGRPEFGSVVAKLMGAVDPAVPPYVGLSPKMRHTPYNSGKPGMLGAEFAPFEPNGKGKGDLVLKDISVDRLDDRKGLLGKLDQFRRETERSSLFSGATQIQQQALGVLTSSRLAEALDVKKESEKTRERYGKGTNKVQGDAAPRMNQQFLMARRLVEAGVRVVTLSYSFWDWHGSNFGNARANLPDLDQAVSALVDDIYDRGLDKDVTILVWGEFGRTPRINKNSGRDHWPGVSCALMSAGGMRTGQAIGETDRLGGSAKIRPVTFQEVHATLYHNLGLDAQKVTVPDLNGRPQYLLDAGHSPIREVI